MSETDKKTKLTAEQVAGFEARAAAGERLVMPWWMKSSDDYVWLDMKNHFGPSVCFDKEGEANPTLVVIGDGHEGLIETTFSTIIAAQLAAEHLLAEATLPLHASALASRAGEIAALREEVRSTNSHLAGNRVNLATMFDLKETYRARAEAAEARVSALESAILDAARAGGQG